MPEIDTDKIYKQLKKQNGEGVAKIIRDAVLLDVLNIVHIMVQEIGSRFLSFNKSLTSLNAPNVEKIGNMFLPSNRCLISMNMPKISPENPDIKRLQFVVANNKLKEEEKQPMPVNMLAQNMEY